MNSANKHNAADQRVYKLLDEKFRLFDGVFGASDEVLGAVESGVDFEKRIAAIYQRCRTPEQIQYEFDQLQRELEIAALEPLVGRSGWLVCTLRALETEDRLVFSGVTDDGMALNETPCRRLFDLPVRQDGPCSIPPATAATLEATQAHRCQTLLEEITTRNGQWFDTEMDKLDQWAEDRRASLRAELTELDDALKDAKKAARLAPCPRNWSCSVRRVRLKPVVMTLGEPTTRPAVRSTRRRMCCSTRSASGWHSTSNTNRSSPCIGRWSKTETR
jgi:hypothetical protein